MTQLDLVTRMPLTRSWGPSGPWPWRSGRFAHVQAGAEEHAPIRPLAVCQPVREEVDSGFSDRRAWSVYRGQRRTEELSDLVVIGHDGKVARNADAPVQRQVDDRHRFGIRVDEQRRQVGRDGRVQCRVSRRRELGGVAVGKERLESLRLDESKLSAGRPPADRDLARGRREAGEDEADSLVAEVREVPDRSGRFQGR